MDVNGSGELKCIVGIGMLSTLVQCAFLDFFNSKGGPWCADLCFFLCSVRMQRSKCGFGDTSTIRK